MPARLYRATIRGRRAYLENFGQLTSLLRERHREIMAGRPEMLPGEFTLEDNRAGLTVFVCRGEGPVTSTLSATPGQSWRTTQATCPDLAAREAVNKRFRGENGATLAHLRPAQRNRKGACFDRDVRLMEAKPRMTQRSSRPGLGPLQALGLLAIAVACSDATAPPVPTSVVVSASSLEFSSLGETVQLTATVHDQNGNAMVGAKVAWASENASVSTVDQSGLVSAAGNGATNITAAAGATASATVAVTVDQVPSTIMLSAPWDSVAVGDSVQMTAEAFDALANPVAEVTFEWSCSDTTVATVDQEGWVRVKAEGSVEISVRLGDLSASSSLIGFPDKERAALEAFYYATGGPEWKNNSNWLTDKPLSQWYGVKTDAAGRVVELDFVKNGLRGRVPVELADLANLRALRLWGDWGPGNSLTGPIPPELAKLSDLLVLNLGNNELTGEIPPELGSLAKLKSLTLVRNQLTGRIPPELGNLSGLTGLNLLNTKLTGRIPPELGKLVRLQDLALGGSAPGGGLTGEIPPDLGNLVELTRLSLGGIGLTGEIPPELGNLAELESLSLYSTSVTGPIPRELGGLSQLRRIWMPDNALTGSIPTELGNLRNLEVLSLDNNNLSGSIPPQLGNLSKLKTLTLARNPLTGEIPPELGRLTQLEYLTLHHTRLTGPIPAQLGNLASLETMFLGGDLTGRIPPELGNLTNLADLQITSHSLTSEIPPELGNLANLTRLTIEGYGITGLIPPELWNLRKLTWLSLAHIGLTGSIPPEIGNLSNLAFLQLVQAPGDFGRRGAAFTGPLPSELGQLSELVGIRIGHHAFTGPLPPEFGNLSNLKSLIIAQAQGDQSRNGIGLTGAIPPELGKLSALKSIWLDSNQLSGTLPPELGSLADLKEVLIGHNDLDGRVPDSFLNLDLERFAWNNNPLCMPDTPAFRAWRGRIPATAGSYCKGSAIAAARSPRYSATQPITVEPLVSCPGKPPAWP